MLTAADADVADGCYRCLERALATYESGLSRGAATGPQAYRTAVHLAVRERLLGLHPGAYQDAPARLAMHGAPADVAAGNDVVPAVAWRRGSLVVGTGMPSPEGELERWRARRRDLATVADSDAWSATLLLSMIGTNFAVGLDEGQTPFRGPLPGLDRDMWWRRHPDDPSLSFARLTLLRSSIDELTAFHTAHPSFDEVDAILGEAELARGRLVSADEALARALSSFPSLVPALALRGDLRQRMEDFDMALTLYDALLVRLPEHREALLGRLKSLGFLGRHADAISAADRMLTLGTWYIGEAHYWKAWNLFNLRQLDDARIEVDQARKLMVNADVDYLGGVIAFRQNRLDDAQRDFDSAVQLESRHCEALFDRAALRLVQQDWAPASVGFDEAFACHAERTATFERRIADAREARLAEDARAALVVKREQALRDHRHQLAWARYNAAVAYANIGKPDITKVRVDEVMALGGPAVDAARDLLIQLRR
jgi:tetratricopeptide (TPR) repeat protein